MQLSDTVKNLLKIAAGSRANTILGSSELTTNMIAFDTKNPIASETSEKASAWPAPVDLTDKGHVESSNNNAAAGLALLEPYTSAKPKVENLAVDAVLRCSA